jgi:uncharacterized protein YoxC
MRNSIPCTASRLGLLEPAMIQSIVEQKAYQRGNQYFSETRVRLLEANEQEIAATVSGNSGVFEQTIRLKDGQLVASCSCSLSEPPMCRHCVAVLLEYHRWVSLRLKRDGDAPLRPAAESHKGNGKAPGGAGHAVSDLKLSEVIGFVEWLQAAVKGMEAKEPLPDSPQQGAGLVTDWITAIKELDRQRRDGEEMRQALQEDVSGRDGQIQQLRQQLKTVQEELEGAKAKGQSLERDIAGYQAMVSKLTALSREICQFDQQIKAVSGDLTKSGSQLEQLSRAFRDVATALQDLGKQQL